MQQYHLIRTTFRSFITHATTRYTKEAKPRPGNRSISSTVRHYKTSYVNDRMTPGDLVVDYESLFVGISMLPIYEKPNEILPNVRLVNSQLIDNIKIRYGRWNNAWIMEDTPTNKYERSWRGRLEPSLYSSRQAVRSAWRD